MAYQVIARKWRPQRFADLVGQEHIAQTLKNAISSGRIAHAYLFVGPRGIGKTTSARIFAKALNCLRPVDGEPCCECSSCVAIANESSVDVIEIDAATHTQVDKAREICEEALHLPIAAKFKTFIIDEVHMLSKSAWNALLKTIEEPPAHVKFIFATTEVNKVLPTVISRCQRFDLRRIPAQLIADRLALIARTEGVKISASAIEVIARAADGGMRDAQSLLDQLISFFGSEASSEISEEQALSLFGLTAPAEMETLVRALLTDDKAAVILAVCSFSNKGKNLEILFDEILSWLRGAMLCKILRNPETVIEEGSEKILLFKKLASEVQPGPLQRLLEQLSSTGYLLREAINKQVFIETLLLKAMRTAHAVQIEDLISRLNQIRKGGDLKILESLPSAALPQAAPQAPAPQQTAPAPAPLPDIKKNDLSQPQPAPVKTPPAPTPAPIQAAPQQPTAPAAPKPPAPQPAAQPQQAVQKPPEPQAAPRPPAPQPPPPASRPAPVQQTAPQQQAKSHAELWRSLIHDIETNMKNSVLASFMREGTTESFANSILTVFFDDEYEKEHFAAVEKESLLLSKRLQSISGDRLATVKVVRRKGLLTSPAEEAVRRDTPERLEQLRLQAKESPFIQSALELFEGRIADIHG